MRTARRLVLASAVIGIALVTTERKTASQEFGARFHRSRTRGPRRVAAMGCDGRRHGANRRPRRRVASERAVPGGTYPRLSRAALRGHTRSQRWRFSPARPQRRHRVAVRYAAPRDRGGAAAVQDGHGGHDAGRQAHRRLCARLLAGLGRRRRRPDRVPDLALALPPELGGNIALGHVPVARAAVGTELRVWLPDEYASRPGQPDPARVCEVPFRPSVNPSASELAHARGDDAAD